MGKEVTKTNAEFINAYNTLGQLLSTTELATQVSWNLGKNFEILETFNKRYAKYQQDLLKKYALVDENGNFKYDENNEILFPPRKKTEYLNALGELLQCEETLDGFVTIKLSDLPDKLKGINLKYINFMIEE